MGAEGTQVSVTLSPTAAQVASSQRVWLQTTTFATLAPDESVVVLVEVRAGETPDASTRDECAPQALRDPDSSASRSVHPFWRGLDLVPVSGFAV